MSDLIIRSVCCAVMFVTRIRHHNNASASKSCRKRGGGLFFGTGEVSLTNSTVTGNQGLYAGGGIYNQAALDIASSTITRNEGGAGLRLSGRARVKVHNSIVSGNDGRDVADETGSTTSLGFNLIGAGDIEAFDQKGDIPGVTMPGLGPLRDNGGLTETHALLPSSPAVDAGDPSSQAEVPTLYDQRGEPYTRVFSGRIDIGAFELQPPRADFDADGGASEGQQTIHPRGRRG